MRRLSALIVLFCSLFVFAAAESTQTQTIRLSVLGDCVIGSTDDTWEYATSFVYKMSQEEYSYPFSLTQSILASDDVTFANLECVFSKSSGNKVKKAFNFRAPPEFARILKLGSVEIVNLANNHTGDYGKTGLSATVDALNAQNIPYSGSTEYGNFWYVYQVNGIKLGFAGISYAHFYSHRGDVAKALQELELAGCQVIIASMHGGVEYGTVHSQKQEAMAEYLIRYGADIVVGHHPHVPQGIAVKDNATVLYSLGNFVYGGSIQPKVIEAYIGSFELLFENGVYMGNTLTIWPVYISGGEKYSDFRPVLVTGAEAATVMDKIQYDTKFQLNPYVYGQGAVQEFIKSRDAVEMEAQKEFLVIE